MKKILNIFFVTLGAIFFTLIIAGIYFFVAGPFHVKSFVSTGKDASIPEVTTDAHPLLSESQEQAVEKFGIDPANIPTEITSTQKTCLMEKLGAERIAELKAGGSPTVADYLKAKDCI